jgi:hypothetical protein
MSVGLGIFLSTLVMALLLLYAITRDRWNWERGFRVVVLATWAISSLAGMGVVGFYVWKRSFPIVQTEYWGLRLGMSMGEVQQVKGKPDVVMKSVMMDQTILFSKMTRSRKTEAMRSLIDGGIDRQEVSGLTLSLTKSLV